MNEQEQVKKRPDGLPAQLKANVEAMSGFNMDDVIVHYNSSKPAQMKALAYTQGTDIHVAPGQEKHLGHEAWHVVQQKQGRVAPTAQLKGININTDDALEHEADVMGARASVFSMPDVPVVQRKKSNGQQGAPMQFYKRKELKNIKNALRKHWNDDSSYGSNGEIYGAHNINVFNRAHSRRGFNDQYSEYGLQNIKYYLKDGTTKIKTVYHPAYEAKLLNSAMSAIENIPIAEQYIPKAHSILDSGINWRIVMDSGAYIITAYPKI